MELYLPYIREHKAGSHALEMLLATSPPLASKLDMIMTSDERVRLVMHQP